MRFLRPKILKIFSLMILGSLYPLSCQAQTQTQAQAREQVVLSSQEVQVLFAQFSPVLLENHQKIVTGAERALLNEFYAYMEVSGLGRSDVYTPEALGGLARKIADLRSGDRHKKDLERELEFLQRLIKKNPAGISCWRGSESVRCAINEEKAAKSVSETQGCSYFGNISIPMDPQNGKPRSWVYKSTLDLGDSGYEFGLVCPD